MAAGGMPPADVSMLSTYSNLDGKGGYAILDITDTADLADYPLAWNGLSKIETTAIMDDETISSVLLKHSGLM